MKMSARLFGLLALSVLSLNPAFAAPPSPAFPLLSSWAGDRELPLPCGASLLGYGQKHGYDIHRLDAFSALDPRIAQMVRQVDPASIDVDNEVTQIGLKADVWLFPFLNAYALAGFIDGETEVDFRELPPAAAPVLGLLDHGLDVDYAGFVYGVGGTLVWGVGPAFAALNGVMMRTDLDEEASVEAYVLRPIIGVSAGKCSFWSGAMYQKTQEDHEGSIGIPGLGAVDYDLELEEKEPWNGLIGASCRISRHWGVETECGLGERIQIEASLTYRF